MLFGTNTVIFGTNTVIFGANTLLFGPNTMFFGEITNIWSTMQTPRSRVQLIEAECDLFGTECNFFGADCDFWAECDLTWSRVKTFLKNSWRVQECNLRIERRTRLQSYKKGPRRYTYALQLFGVKPVLSRFLNRSLWNKCKFLVGQLIGSTLSDHLIPKHEWFYFSNKVVQIFW